MVRLKVEIPITSDISQMFQFPNGSIKREHTQVSTKSSLPFQFPNGSIKSAISSCVIPRHF